MRRIESTYKPIGDATYKPGLTDPITQKMHLWKPEPGT